MEIEEAIDILENIIDDEVIGTYCVEIQKEGVNCSKNCEDKDCYLSEAISTTINYIKALREENIELIADKNKLINYIAIREDMDFKDVCKKFEEGRKENE